MASRSRSALSFTTTPLARPLAALLAIALAAPLAGCGTSRIKVDSENGMDARMRHPIALMNLPYTLDVFPSSGRERLDTRTQEQLMAFARRYSEVGSGPISVVVLARAVKDA